MPRKKSLSLIDDNKKQALVPINDDIAINSIAHPINPDKPKRRPRINKDSLGTVEIDIPKKVSSKKEPRPILAPKKIKGKVEKTKKVLREVFKSAIKPKKKAIKTTTKQSYYPVFIDSSLLQKEILKNKDCHIICISDTSVVFVKRIQISVTKINENSVFQPHEKTDKNTYCVVVVFEYNHKMEEFDRDRFNFNDQSKQYFPLLMKGAHVYTIHDVNEIESILKGIE